MSNIYLDYLRNRDFPLKFKDVMQKLHSSTQHYVQNFKNIRHLPSNIHRIQKNNRVVVDYSILYRLSQDKFIDVISGKMEGDIMTIEFDLEASNSNLLQSRYLSKHTNPSVVDFS